MPCLWRGTGFWATQASQVSSSIQSSLHGSIWECREWFKHQTESLNLTLTLQNMKQDEIKASLNQLWNYLTCAPTPTQGSTIGFVSNWISPHDMRSQRLCLAVSLENCCKTLAVLGSGTKIPNVEFIETREMPQKSHLPCLREINSLLSNFDPTLPKFAATVRNQRVITRERKRWRTWGQPQCSTISRWFVNQIMPLFNGRGTWNRFK